jgi:hypothetical protein
LVYVLGMKLKMDLVLLAVKVRQVHLPDDLHLLPSLSLLEIILVFVPAFVLYP